MYKDVITKALERATGEKSIQIDVPEIAEHGDYSSNVAMATFENSKLKTPRELAEAIVERLKNDKTLMEVVDRIEVAGPGFVNFWLKIETILENVSRVVEKKDKYGGSKVGKGKRILVEYSSPNIAKRFGIGHLRSTIIGNAIYNLYKTLGYEVIGENHLGDWGTQFGVILAAIHKYKINTDKMSIDMLEKIYVDFNKEAETDPVVWDEAKDWFKKLEEGNKEARNIWLKVREISLDEFKRIYTRLGVKTDQEHGESFYEDKMPSIVKLLRDNKLAKKSEGAEIVEFSKTTGLSPAILTKSDGTSTYYTRDLAALKYRIEKWDPSTLIYEVGSDQILHFRQVFETAKMLGWAEGRTLVHVAHGLIRFKEGKMSTRRGKTIKLEEVLDMAVEKAKKFNSDTKISEMVGIGAVKYFDLSHTPTSDIIFDWNKIFVLEGNSGPYLQYTYARAESVLRKAIGNRKVGSSLEHLTPSAYSLVPEELEVLRSLVHFPEVIEYAAYNFAPNILCNYLFDLAQKFNGFYNKHRILDESLESSVSSFRVDLTRATSQVLKNGLNLLGIQAPDSM